MRCGFCVRFLSDGLRFGAVTAAGAEADGTAASATDASPAGLRGRFVLTGTSGCSSSLLSAKNRVSCNEANVRIHNQQSQTSQSKQQAASTQSITGTRVRGRATQRRKTTTNPLTSEGARVRMWSAMSLNLRPKRRSNRTNTSFSCSDHAVDRMPCEIRESARREAPETNK